MRPHADEIRLDSQMSVNQSPLSLSLSSSLLFRWRYDEICAIGRPCEGTTKGSFSVRQRCCGASVHRLQLSRRDMDEHARRSMHVVALPWASSGTPGNPEWIQCHGRHVDSSEVQLAICRNASAVLAKCSVLVVPRHCWCSTAAKSATP